MKPRKIIELQLRILAPKRLFGYCVERIGALGFTKLTKIKICTVLGKSYFTSINLPTSTRGS